MGVTVRTVMGHRLLGLKLLTEGSTEAEIVWSHSSDLDDPTPFLEPGQLLLTTGTQFAEYDTREKFDEYVARLCAAGVVALGFGTEVVREGTPQELTDACGELGLTLLEVPYATPFIAVSKFIADHIAGEARQRLEWALSAQAKISAAVLGSKGLAAAIVSASSALECSIAVLDSDGAVLEGSAPVFLQQEATRLLNHRRRALDSGEHHNDVWVVQTLGASGRLVGALVLQRSSALGPDELSIVNLLTALTELALEHAEDRRLGFRAISQQLLGLLLGGEITTVQEALAYYPTRLPEEPFRVISLSAADLDPAVYDSLERMAAGRRYRMFPVRHREELLLFVDDATHGEVQVRLAVAGVRAGVSADSTWNRVRDSIGQASAALAAAPVGTMLSFEKLMLGRVLGLLTEGTVKELARLRLGDLARSPQGRERLAEAATWLRFNGAWDPAGRELGLHRHALKSRITALGEDLDLVLDEFAGRAELWALLASLNLITAQPRRSTN